MEKYVWNKVNINPKSAHPMQRWGHSCCVIDDEVIYFGGYAGTFILI